MTGSFSQAKGKRGEREILKYFVQAMRRVEFNTDLPGDSARVKRNTMQADRGGDDLHGLPLVSVEVKRAETLNIASWWQQCEIQCAAQSAAHAEPKLPVLFYRQSRKPWSVMTYVALTNAQGAVTCYVVGTLTSEDFFDYYAQLYREELERRKSALTEGG